MSSTYVKSLKTPIAIVGLGKSGQSALKLLEKSGFTSDQIITFDEKSSDAKVRDTAQLVNLKPKTLVVSPGVSLKQDWISTLIQNGAHLTSEISIAASFITTEKLIGITGSVGKSTVTSLLGAGALTFDPNAFVGGNLGTPFCDYALALLNGKKKATWVILELSSFQLENCELLTLDNSIVTYLSANHLERYASLEDYYKTKLKITEITKNLCLFGKTSKDCDTYSKFSKCRHRLVNAENFSHPELLGNIFLLGSHNKDNFAIAIETARACAWPESSFIEMAAYRGLPHRLEFVAELGGVVYVNDSKATSMDSVLVAVKGCLESKSQPQSLYLMLGGKDKNLPWEALNILKSKEQIKPVFFGLNGQLAKEKSGLAGEYFEMLGSAINYCQKRARSGDIVLLSPGGTSLDEFKNFEERGDFFKTLVLSQLDA